MMSYTSVLAGLCRVCLRHAPLATVPLLSGSQHTPIATALCQLAPAVNISSTDLLPKQICVECVIQVVRGERFRRKAETTHAKLMTIVSTSQPGEVHEDIVTYSMYKHYFPDEQMVKQSKSDIQARVVAPSSISKGARIPEDYGQDFWPDDTSHMNERSQDMIPTVPTMAKAHRNQDVKNLEKTKILPASNTGLLQKAKSVPVSSHNVLPAREANVDCLPTRRSALVTCRVCDKRLLRLSYRAHLKRHYAPEFVCEHCGADFYTRGELASHLAFTHGTGRGLVCDHCGKVFRSKQIIREHLFRHSGMRPYACPHCPRTFYNKQVSVNHAKRHSATRNFKCERCPRAFFTAAELWSHSNSMHERRHLYRCTHCPTTYAKIATVRAHLTAAHGVARDQQGPLPRVPAPPAPPNQQS